MIRRRSRLPILTFKLRAAYVIPAQLLRSNDYRCILRSADLCVPLPKDRKRNQPALFSLWDDWEAVPSVALTPAGIAEIASTSRSGLLRFIEGSAVSLAQWLAFQFTPAIVKDHVLKHGSA